MAKESVAEWLPDYGLSRDQVDEFLDSLATRTGILVREGGSHFVFAQFGLQEYFASIGLVESYSHTEIAELSPKEWWRESVLLCTAQQRDPTTLLEALFEKDPLLAAAAVAECPTPSTGMQSRAATACQTGIDEKDRAVGAAVVPLLRKLTGNLESDLCSSLEQRLTGDDEVSSLVGRTLATAGTPAATGVLGRHPEIWNTCLSSTGYLSESFENMLVDWIRVGDNLQSERAAELISSRLSNERSIQLARMLKDLEPTRADNLASLLVLRLESLEVETGPYYNPFRSFSPAQYMWLVSCCVPHVSDPEAYVRRAEKLKPKPDSHYGRIVDTTGLVRTALHIEKGGKRVGSEDVMHILVGSARWLTWRRAFLCWLCAVAICLVPPSLEWGGLYYALLLLTFAVYIFRRGRISWIPGVIYIRHALSSVTFLLMIGSALVALVFTLDDHYVLKAKATDLAHFGLVLVGTLAGFAVSGSQHFSGANDVWREVGFKHLLFRSSTVGPVLYAVLVFLLAIGTILIEMPKWGLFSIIVVSACMGTLIVYQVIILRYSCHLYGEAEDRALKAEARARS